MRIEEKINEIEIKKVNQPLAEKIFLVLYFSNYNTVACYSVRVELASV